MGLIRRSGTAPEIAVRRAASASGLHYRLKNDDLPGSPDLANRSRKFAVFVHGCFWHRHAGCVKATLPKNNRAFWETKFSVNVRRDQKAIRALRKHGYQVVVVWECDVIDDHGKRSRKLLEKLSKRVNRLGV